MGDQPATLLVVEGFAAGLLVLVGIVLGVSWLMGRQHRARGHGQLPPERGEVSHLSHVGSSLGR